MLLGGGGALYRLEGDRIVRIGADQQTGQVTFFHKMRDGSLLIGGQDGLFHRDGDRLFRITDLSETGKFFSFAATRDDVLLLTGPRGLFRLKDGVVAKLGDEHTGYPGRTKDGTVLVKSSHGLLRLDGDRLVAISPEQDTGWIT